MGNMDSEISHVLSTKLISKLNTKIIGTCLHQWKKYTHCMKLDSIKKQNVHVVRKVFGIHRALNMCMKHEA